MADIFYCHGNPSFISYFLDESVVVVVIYVVVVLISDKEPVSSDLLLWNTNTVTGRMHNLQRIILGECQATTNNVKNKKPRICSQHKKTNVIYNGTNWLENFPEICLHYVKQKMNNERKECVTRRGFN